MHDSPGYEMERMPSAQNGFVQKCLHAADRRCTSLCERGYNSQDSQIFYLLRSSHYAANGQISEISAEDSFRHFHIDQPPS